MIDLSQLARRWHVTFRDSRLEERRGFYSGRTNAGGELWITSTSGGTAGWWVRGEQIKAIEPPAKERK